jgi:hypothetical protein
MASKTLAAFYVLILMIFSTPAEGAPPAPEMYMKCKICSHRETLDKRFFLKIVGGAVAGFGFWAWVSFLFAGTGLALPICIAIVAGGVGIAAYSNEIAEWVSARYDCPHCGARNWSVVKE